MENLRWILLGIAIVAVLLIIARSVYQRSQSIDEPFSDDERDDANSTWGDVGVGKPRVKQQRDATEVQQDYASISAKRQGQPKYAIRENPYAPGAGSERVVGDDTPSHVPPLTEEADAERQVPYFAQGGSHASAQQAHAASLMDSQDEVYLANQFERENYRSPIETQDLSDVVTPEEQEKLSSELFPETMTNMQIDTAYVQDDDVAGRSLAARDQHAEAQANKTAEDLFAPLLQEEAPAQTNYTPNFFPEEELADIPESKSAPDSKSDFAVLSTASGSFSEPVEAEELLVIFHIARRDGGMMFGSAIQSALTKQSLEFGEMDIYHRMMGRDGRERVLFSVASMVKPGTLTPQELPRLKTPGLSLFLRLPNCMESIKAFDAFLMTAGSLAEDLGAMVLDDKRRPLTERTAVRLRNRVAEIPALRLERQRH